MEIFQPGLAYWNQRHVLRAARDRILALSGAVDRPSDCSLFQYAQLMATAMEFRPDVILELGRGTGNSTCVFTEASNQMGGSTRIVSLCNTNHWAEVTVPKLKPLVPGEWFAPLETIQADILAFDYRKVLASARRIMIFWDAHGWEIAECILGDILPQIASIPHLVCMHDISDNRYLSQQHLDYGEQGLWKGVDSSGSRVMLGHVNSAVAQSVAVVDFTTRNHLTLESADHSIRTGLSAEQHAEMKADLDELFAIQAHWFYFSLNEHPGPYTFPKFVKPAVA